MATLGVATWADLSIDLEGPKTLKVTKEDLKAKGGAGSFSVDSNGYKILRGLKEDSLEPLGDVQTDTYKDSTVTNGVIYFYAVKAVYSAGTSENSQIAKVQPLSRASIEPLTVNDKAGGGALKVSWKASTGASAIP